MLGKKNINEWTALIQKNDSALISRFESIYGPEDALVNVRLKVFLKIAAEFKNVYGADREVSFVRAPGRLNTLGRHLDHRGGFVNPISINKEIVLCYAPRNDDLIQIHNLDASYGARSFNIRKEVPSEKISTVRNWLVWTQHQTNTRAARGVNQDWVNKLKSIPVYLQVKFPGKNLCGLDGVLDSNIPPGMGLSSSSAIVVAMMEAMLDCNGITLTDDEFVNYCGIAEWFVGTRGGSGDHAAIKYGRFGMITHMKTLPELMIKSYLPFPEGRKLMVFNSGITSDKSGSARQKFNEKIATYEIGEIYIREYLKKHHPRVFEKVLAIRIHLPDESKRFYLADLVEYLNLSQICKLLLSLPVQIDRAQLSVRLPEHKKLLQEQFATHNEPQDGYQIRSVITFGVAESKRSTILEKVVKEGNYRLYGKLMSVSHDGDRVSFISAEQKKRKRAVDPRKKLHMQPGGYDCSIPEIDEMVDLALRAGAEGAQISGAGFGGSMMALVKQEHLCRVRERFRTDYYLRHKIQEECILVSPIQGAGLL